MASNARDVQTYRPRERETADRQGGGAGPARIESSFEIDRHHVRVSVRRLDEYERERVAAEIAWFADVLSTPGVDADAVGWMPFIQRLLDDVDITVDDDVVDRLP